MPVRPHSARSAHSARPAVRLARAVGVGPLLLVMSAGLLASAEAVRRSWAGEPDTAALLHLLGLALVVVPAVAGVLLPGVRSVERVLLAVALPVLLQLDRLVLHPVRPVLADDLLQAAVLRRLETTGRLTADPSQTLAGAHAGLALAADAVGDLTGLGALASVQAVLVAARLLLALAVVAVVRQMTGSTRAGATAAVLQACAPSLPAAADTLGLALAAFVVHLLLRRASGSARDTVLGTVLGLAAAVPVLAATVVASPGAAIWLVVALVVWAGLDLALRRGRGDAAALATVAAAGAGLLLAGSALPGSPLRDDPGRLLRADPLLSGAGLPAGWPQALAVAAVFLPLVPLAAALPAARGWLRRRVPLAVLLYALAALLVVVPATVLPALVEGSGSATGVPASAAAALRAAAPLGIGVGFALAWHLSAYRRQLRAGQALAAAAVAGAVAVGGVVLSYGPPQAQLPGPYGVSAEGRSVDAANLAAARWMAANLPAGSRVYADRAGGLLAAAVGGHTPVRQASSGVDASRLLLEPEAGLEDVAVVQRARVAFVVADRRNAFGLPESGIYAEPGEPGAAGRVEPVPEQALRKLDGLRGVSRVYDNGTVAVYDVRPVAEGAPS